MPLLEADNDCFEVEWEDLFPDNRPWWRRLWDKLRGRSYEALSWDDSDDEETSIEESHDIPLLVAQRIEEGLCGTVWVHRGLDEEAPLYYQFLVRGVIVIPDDEDNHYQLVIDLCPKEDGAAERVPLHEFLQSFMPLRELHFTDYNA